MANKETEDSAASRTTTSTKKWRLNPGDIDDATIRDMGGFKHAKTHKEDPAYKLILRKSHAGTPTETFSGKTIPALAPSEHEEHEDFKDWSRGKPTEKP